MASFDNIFKLIMQHEGGYVNDHNDSGGETYCGISRPNHENWDGWSIIDANKPLAHNQKIIGNIELNDMVYHFYKSEVWDKIKGDNIQSQRIADMLADWYTTSGKHAISAIQKIVGVETDGVIGLGTVTAINNANESETFEKFKQSRIDFYNGIVANNPNQEKFLQGWINRVNSFA